MSLKILIFPIFVVLILTIIIGYIKPEISVLLEKRNELAQKIDTLTKIDSVIQNIKSQNAAISSRSESETFVMKYLPTSLEEERVLDTFNYLAAQSGVIITNLSMEENNPVEEQVSEPLRASQSFKAVTDAGIVGGATPAEPITRSINSYKATVSVVGAYSNLKDFFSRLNRTDRFHETNLFSIQERVDERNNEDEPTFPADYLKGTFVADFIYFSPTPIRSVVEQPIFQTAKFDFSTVDKLLNYVKNPLPVLEIGTVGKANPFQ